MNVYDSGLMMESLRLLNYSHTESINIADIIIVNTCAIREKAVQKVYSFIGRLYDYKKKNKNLIIIVSGCVAQQQGLEIKNRFPHVDIVIGTQAIHRLPTLLQQAKDYRQQIIDIEMRNDLSEFDFSKTERIKNADISCFVTIMRGCDNYCSYCVVPYVRGREVSRQPLDILNEIKILVESGTKEVTLLGQNVNSYGAKEGIYSFPELLAMVNRVDGLERIRFVTSHPKDLSDPLIGAFKILKKLCNHIHLPVQSGSNQILKKMNRKYTHESYVQKIEKLRAASPSIAITTDIIVGFPGETREDFDMTLKLMESVQFDNIFVFEYSDRPNAPASHFTDKLTSNIKNERLQEVLQLHKTISGKKNRLLIGNVFSVLVEGDSKKYLKQNSESLFSQIELTGRTSENRVVNFNIKSDCGLDIESMKGQIIDIRIEKACENSLWGTPVDVGCRRNIKGDFFYVA